MPVASTPAFSAARRCPTTTSWARGLIMAMEPPLFSAAGLQPALIHARISAVAGHAQGSGLECTGNHLGDKLLLAHLAAHVIGRAGDRGAEYGHGEFPAPEGQGEIRLFDAVNGAHVQPDPGQCVHVGFESATGSGTAHAGYLSGAGPAITDRADAAKAFKLFPGLFPDRFHFHLCFLLPRRADSLRTVGFHTGVEKRLLINSFSCVTDQAQGCSRLVAWPIFTTTKRNGLHSTTTGRCFSTFLITAMTTRAARLFFSEVLAYFSGPAGTGEQETIRLAHASFRGTMIMKKHFHFLQSAMLTLCHSCLIVAIVLLYRVA